jgi:4-hydroxy-3-polyprenylbenzoate decarboxylase
MDVLDHSCSKLGFGGKMCIDGTTKEEEEIDTDGYQLTSVGYREPVGDGAGLLLTEKELTDRWPAITSVNLNLLKLDIPCILVAVKKDQPGHIRELHQALIQIPAMEGVKMILYVEHTVDARDLGVALWRLCNNLDPRRDHILTETPSTIEPNKTFACLGLDGTRKTKELDNFQRDWPNIIVADDATIKAVDEKWKELGLGAFLPSPSLKFKDQLYGVEAVVS